MNIDQLSNVESLSIRARVAYCLCLAESVLIEVKHNKDGNFKAKSGLDKCWDWLSPELSIPCEDICYLLANEDDTGLSIYSSLAGDREIEYSAWGVIIYTIAYTAWQAFNYEKEGLPSIIESIDEDTIIEIFEYLQKIPVFDEKYALTVKSVLVEKFSFDPTNEFGIPIDKKQISR
jgi:Immunity protein Imm6